MGDHLSFHDLANLGAVSKQLADATKPIIDIANLCKPQSVYPNLVINDYVSPDCLQLLKAMFHSGQKKFKFKEISVVDWRVLAAGVPVTHLDFNGDNSFANMDWNSITKALETFQGKITIRNTRKFEGVARFFREVLLYSPVSEISIFFVILMIISSWTL